VKHRWRIAVLALFSAGTLIALADRSIPVRPGTVTTASPSSLSGAHARKTRNVVLVMIDGLRWEEVFQGADEHQLHVTAQDGLDEPGERARMAAEDFSRPSADARRRALMPFFWSVIAPKGQIFGNRALGSDSHTANPLAFSYPGYAETLTGFVDARVDSNDNKPNPNPTVLEWLNRNPRFAGSVAAFTGWQVFQGILRSGQCGFLVNAGFDPLELPQSSGAVDALNTLKAEQPRIFSDVASDAFPFHSAVEYIQAAKPRVVYLQLGETDDWAHVGSYTEYLRAAHRDDAYIQQLWTMLQSMPEYKDSTTLIVLPDHGRGRGSDWTSHGAKVSGSRETWMAFLGPDTAPLGERKDSAPVTESQIASTVAAFLGQNYRDQVPKAAAPISDVLN
jgi:hypothetical protein